jgi:hypothetical protein
MTRSEAITELYSLFGAPHNADINLTRLNKLLDELTEFPPAQQEPVLWEMPDGKTADKWALQFYRGQKGKPLYTTPPQREWVGLTDGEVKHIEETTTCLGNESWLRNLTQAIEAKLKEKNG